MGWGGGTEIFDTVAEVILEADNEIDCEKLLTNLYNVLRDHDWDVVDESSYYDDPYIREILKTRTRLV